MAQVKLMVLYPQPTDINQFEKDYQAHLALFHSKMDISTDARDYEVIKLHAAPNGAAPYYQMFCFNFSSKAALEKTLATEAMQAVAADANRISSGGAPVIWLVVMTKVLLD